MERRRIHYSRGRSNTWWWRGSGRHEVGTVGRSVVRVTKASHRGRLRWSQNGIARERLWNDLGLLGLATVESASSLSNLPEGGAQGGHSEHSTKSGAGGLQTLSWGPFTRRGLGDKPETSRNPRSLREFWKSFVKVLINRFLDHILCENLIIIGASVVVSG